MRMGALLRAQGSELLRMGQQQLKGELCVAWIVLGAADVEGLPVLSQGRRIDREEHQERIALQGIHQRSLSELKTHSNWPSAKALLQPLSPLRDCLGAVWQDG
jgi:hypothetical protein